MRKLILLLIILCFALQVRASECTAYLCEIYSNEYNSKVKIVSKKEFIDKYEQKVGDYYISSIVYGYGYMKIPKCKKQRISYITLIGNDCKPIWGYVIPR
ncbi:TPA: hypothetical protein CPT90_09335 [Candidatus Gastranaerophilales bacterium HUM_3]|jgi:hypothetical protein|nr:hypothetical protein [Acinetobacter sp.]CCZ51270.1 unknown [Acinetobacter sp. CAG:196]DAA81540.1 MAG TPA: hypothetical protein CPT90_09335 [Candidatus Gastranaerophilales bacterium HUM_3]DAA99853.1 MAG TPA: hypothetical protein CPT96_07655 [Candidatus Gastranaerophilales bacterium HUM_10]DAB11712.1 MAG TPA: hypothetical protein CPT91_04010 [Candidatus Gastranaerophilales bacterium HUM_16]DAB15205.1 MAG TPA: hypothetical protein CPU00_06795 [Candidatus Gastranaerophilales bacterium HUM_18]D